MLQRRHDPAISSIFLSALLFTVFCFVGAALCSSYESKISKSFFVKKNQTLKLNSDLGAVTVKSRARDVVKIDVIKKVRASGKRKAEDLFNRFKVDFVQNNRGIELKGDYHGTHDPDVVHPKGGLHLLSLNIRIWDLSAGRILCLEFKKSLVSFI